MTLLRLTGSLLLALGLAAVMVACSDSAVGPSEARHDESATAWLKRNPWFEAELVPDLRGRVAGML